MQYDPVGQFTVEVISLQLQEFASHRFFQQWTAHLPPSWAPVHLQIDEEWNAQVWWDVWWLTIVRIAPQMTVKIIGLAQRLGDVYRV